MSTDGRDGTFLVRRSKNGGEESPFALTIYYNDNLFHINVRAVYGRKFALGKSKVHEMVRKLETLYLWSSNLHINILPSSHSLV